MKFGRALLGIGDGVIDRVLCVIGAVLFSQTPEFMQQYLQRLGGHLDEARRHLAQFQRVAEQSGLSLDGLINRTSINDDAAVARLGGVMTDAVARVEELEIAQHALQSAPVWQRPFVFLEHVDRAIAQATWDIYRPAVPTTVEGVIYALIGIFVLLAIYQLGVRYPAVRIARARQRRLQAQHA